MVSLAQFDPAVEEAARNLGAGRWRTFFRITLPLIRPGVLAGSVFAFIISFDELVVTLFLTAPGLQTLPIRIYHLRRVFERPHDLGDLDGADRGVADHRSCRPTRDFLSVRHP